MVDWFCDELPYWLCKIEYYTMLLIMGIIKYSVLFVIQVYVVIRAAIVLLLRD